MSLAAVGSIDIPGRALSHPNVLYAHALASVFAGDGERVERVIGTENNQTALSPQLYGWAPNVAPHKDDTGFIYFAPVIVDASVVQTRRNSVVLKRGGVYRLYDFVDHWTVDSKPVVSLFIGPYRFPQDAEAALMLQVGADALADRKRAAPAVRSSFRMPMRGEVYAYKLDAEMSVEIVALREARANRWHIARCALCELFAVRVDRFFPMHSDDNRCARCFVEHRDVPRETTAIVPEAA